jgi:hypothetical protein
MFYIEVPDPDVIRATGPVETSLASRLTQEDISPPLSKSYCAIGMTRMIVDYAYPVEVGVA